VSVGLFGKLPAKRDFIEHAVDRAVMEKWDPWLQQAVSLSRERLGPDWLGVYLRAPIWRFWLGPGICGRTVLGALMPSVDGVGRYFPLSLVWSGDALILPPEIDEQADWFAAAEEILLGALAEDARYEGVLAALHDLPEPRGAGTAAEEDASVAGLFRRLRHDQAAEVYGGLSCWWVPAHEGGDAPARALMCRGLPAPAEYSDMIGGMPSDAMSVAEGEA
jgi:type VI secretion system protein ImpM